MKVIVDLDKCEDHGQCVLAAPEVFDFDDEDTLVWDQAPGEAQRAHVEHAANICPVLAIRIESESQ
ncbi:ferredoxin [Nocardia sp. R16R-3T]|uniref:4Fe-4S domain-containing protein n=1 Tax=Nocardia sp. R6R-6 TaxID=3459303 RepID=UPI00403D56AB